MAEMTAAQITEYLKQALLLEISVYKQSEIKEKASGELWEETVLYDEPTPPKAPPKTPSKPQTIDLIDLPEARSKCRKFLLLPGLCLTALGVLNIMADTGMGIMAVFVILLGIALVVINSVQYRSCITANEQRVIYNKNEILAFEKRKAEEEAKYQKDYEEYLKQKKQAEAKYKKATERAHQKYVEGKQQVAKLSAPLAQTKRLLTQLYNKDIVFPKYRNLMAIGTIYEYFASGRCSELTGANGAYNLYEAELRQNLIIGNLEMVNRNLEQIKQNQYTLYQEIKETQAVLMDLSSDVRRLVKTTKEIAEYSKLTAFYSKVTAENTEVQKYLMLLKG